MQKCQGKKNSTETDERNRAKIQDKTETDLQTNEGILTQRWFPLGSETDEGKRAKGPRQENCTETDEGNRKIRNQHSYQKI